jgi:hypothetical protein
MISGVRKMTISITLMTRDQISQDADLESFAEKILNGTDDTDTIYKFQAKESDELGLTLRIQLTTVIVKDEEETLRFWNGDCWIILENIGPLLPKTVESLYPGARVALDKHHDGLFSDMMLDDSFDEVMGFPKETFDKTDFVNHGAFYIDALGLHHVCYDKKCKYYDFLSTPIYWKNGYWEV